MKVLRIYHGGRDTAHRERDRALVRAGVDLTLVVPAEWPGVNDLGNESFEILELPVLGRATSTATSLPTRPRSRTR